MVELSGKSDPFQHSFPNVVFIIPAIIVIGLSGQQTPNYLLYKYCISLNHRQSSDKYPNDINKNRNNQISIQSDY